MNDSKNSKLGTCEVCGDNLAKYTCPKCEVKSCSLNCVNIHKKELNCSGLRDKTRYVPLSKFTNLDLLSDYRLLEEVNRSVETLKKDKSKQYTRIHKNLPRHLYLLKKELTQRKTTIQFLPGNFTRHKENTTHLDFKSKIVYWRIELIFIQADNFRIIDEKCDENLKLSHIIDDYLDSAKYTNDKLKYYQAVGLSNLNFYMKAENRSGNKFYNLESYLSLKECLKNKTVVEYPTINVAFKDHSDIFDTIESDEELEISGPLNPVRYVSELVKAEERNTNTNGNRGSLMFVSEYDGELSMSSDEN